MKKLFALTVLCLFLAGCAAAPAVTTGTTEAPTNAAPTTAAPTTEAPPEEDTVPPGYHHSALAGNWICTGTEVEGYVNDAVNCKLVITAVGDGSYLISYSDLNFPEYSYEDKAIHIVEEPLYEGCGNDCWMGVIDYAYMRGHRHELTIRDDGVLVIRNTYTMDGIPMVSHEFFDRVP